MRQTGRLLIAGNWKMNCTTAEAARLSSRLKDLLMHNDDVDIALFPPFTALRDVSGIISGSGIMLGAQDMFYEDKGAFTGEISPLMLKELGCRFVLVGHSERRLYFFETNHSVKKKLKACLMHGLTPIMCVGETEQEYGDKLTKRVIEEQLTEGLEGMRKEEISRIVIAYEPVWAIGTGRTATPRQAQDAHSFIKETLMKVFGAKCSKIIYGGSVKPDNIKELVSQPDIDGALVGGASLQAESFAEIVDNATGM